MSQGTVLRRAVPMVALEWFPFWRQSGDISPPTFGEHHAPTQRLSSPTHRRQQRFIAKGLTVMGFPCNQFGGQDPGSNEEIGAFCQKNYGVSFPMMAKINVNGADAHPLFQWLKAQAPGILGSEGIKWNFTKFLVGKDGQVLARYAPTDTPAKIAKDIEAALAA